MKISADNPTATGEAVCRAYRRKTRNGSSQREGGANLGRRARTRRQRSAAVRGRRREGRNRRRARRTDKTVRGRNQRQAGREGGVPDSPGRDAGGGLARGGGSKRARIRGRSEER